MPNMAEVKRSDIITIPHLQSQTTALDNDGAPQIVGRVAQMKVRLSKSSVSLNVKVNSGTTAERAHAVPAADILKMFSKAELIVGDETVEINNRPGDGRIVQKLTNESRDNLDVMGLSSGTIYNLRPRDSLVADSTWSTDDDETKNISYARRARQHHNGTTDSRYVAYEVPLSDIFGFAAVDKLLFGVDVTVRLTRNNTPTELIMRDSSSTVTDYTLTLYDMALNINAIELLPEAAMRFDQMITSGASVNEKYSSYNAYVDDSLGQQTSPTLNFSNDSRKALNVYLLRQPLTARTSYNVDSCIYPNMGLTEASLLVNNNTYPVTPVKCDFGANSTSVDIRGSRRLYRELVGAADDSFEGHGCLSYEDFVDRYNIIRFNLEEAGEEVFWGSDSLNAYQLKFTHAPSEDFRAIVVVEFENEFQLMADGTSGRMVVKSIKK